MTRYIPRTLLACALASLLAFALLPAFSLPSGWNMNCMTYAEEVPAADRMVKRPVAVMPSEAEVVADGAPAEDDYPEWALLPDGSPNPAFVNQDGSMITIDPDDLHDSGYVYSYVDEDGNTVIVNEENAPDVLAPGRPDVLDNHSLSALTKPFDRFFSLNNGVALFGSGSAWRHYFVPANSGIPLVSLCIEKALRNPGDDSPTAGVERGVDAWMTNLASWAPSILSSYGLTMGADDNANKTLVAYVQTAVWVRQGVLSASDGGLLDSLVASTYMPAVSSNPKVTGIPDNKISVPTIVIVNGTKYGRHGPFKYSGGANSAKVKFYVGDPAKNITTKDAYVGKADGTPVSNTIPNGTSFYIFLPKQAAETPAIRVRISTSWSSIVPGRTFTVAAGQDQFVIPQWDPVSGERIFSFRLKDLTIDEYLIRITKKDAETGNVVLGKNAAYRIFNLENNKYVEMEVSSPEPVIYGTMANPFETGEDGTLILPQVLPIGAYRLEEIAAPEGYVLAGEEQRVLIDFSKPVYDAEAGEDVIEVVQKNMQQKGRLNIFKAKEDPADTGSPLYETLPMEGVVFQLYAAEDIFSLDGSGTLVHEKGSLVGSMTTGPAGDAYLENIYLGKYILRELDIADDDKTMIGGALRSKYNLLGDINVEFTAQEQSVSVFICNQALTNVYRLGRIVIEKVADRTNAPLKNVVFTVLARRDIFDMITGDMVWSAGDVIGTITTDKDGLASIGDLLPGDYTLRETRAPAGYLPAPDKDFTIEYRSVGDKYEFFIWKIVNQQVVTHSPAKTADPFRLSAWILLLVAAAMTMILLRATRRLGSREK